MRCCRGAATARSLVAAATPCGAGRGLRRALALLVPGEVLRRLDVPEGRTCRCHLVPAGRLDPEPAPDDRDQRAGLHLADARQREQPALEVAPVDGLGPDPARVVAVVLGNHLRQRLDLAGHAAGEAVDGGRRPEHALELGWVRPGDAGRVQVTQPAAKLQRPAECLLDRDLLVEGEPDEERERLLDQEAVGLVVAGEGKSVGGRRR